MTNSSPANLLPLQVSAHSGKGVVLDFWATWCGPCVAAIPHLNELATKFKGKPIVFLSITPESRPAVEAFLAKRPKEGWIGFSNDHKVFNDYGLEGVGRTFLIDAAGKLAAEIEPQRVTAAMLDDLIALRPITVSPSTSILSPMREGTDLIAKPLIDVIIRPSTAIIRGGASATNIGELAMRAAPLSTILMRLYTVQPSRMSGEPLEDKTRYDLSISIPGASRETVQAIAREAVFAALKIAVAKEARDTDVYILTAPNGKPAQLIEAAPSGAITTRVGKGNLKLNGGSIFSLAANLEMALGKPVLDETKIQGAFDISLSWQDGAPDTVETAVANLGLKLERSRRPVDFLIVSKR